MPISCLIPSPPLPTALGLRENWPDAGYSALETGIELKLTAKLQCRGRLSGLSISFSGVVRGGKVKACIVRIVPSACCLLRLL